MRSQIAILIGSVALLAATLAAQNQHLDEGTRLLEDGKYPQSKAAYDLALQEAERGAGDQAVADVLFRQGAVFTKLGDFTAARNAYERALAISQKTLGPDDPLIGITLTVIAMTHQQQGHYATAESLYRRSLGILEKTTDEKNRASAELGLAKLLCAQKRYGEAQGLLETALPAFEVSHQPDGPNFAIALVNLAESYRADGRYAKAEPLYQRALRIVEDQPALNTPEIQSGLEHYAQMLRRLKRKDQAREIEGMVKTLVPR